MPLTPQQAQSLAEQLLDDEDPADASSGPPAPACDAQNQGLPQNIGPYRIVGVIASGGMGVVYEAEQDHPRRVVALKVLKHGLASPSALRRFEHEAQVLARLRHDGIAHIYDAGTHDDGSGAVPYFAMEFIPNALSIVQFARDHKLSMRARLELFADVCNAVHHGHQKGIIHRDLKPANILVESTDYLAPGERTGGQECKAASVSGGGRGLVKIIDFGIARATDADVALTTLQTDVRELIGTLQYMSPEQVSGGVDGDPHDLDIRSDIYSLGVALYELLTGHLPYDLSHKSLPSATRMIQECDPPRPSTMSKQFRGRGDLEAILLKTLQKDREKRYQSAMDLCRDVRRYLRGEPIEARPPSRWSLSMRWVARHPLVTTTAACLMIALLTLGTTSLSVWYLNFRPHHIELTPDGQEARLMSVRNNILDTWRTEAENGIRFAELVKRPAEHGGGHLALIGFSSAYENPYPGELCAFDISHDRDHPIWTARITDEDLLPEHIEHGYKSAGVGVNWCDVQDVFAVRDHPGSEVIACYQHGPGSACAVRIYDLSGELLYQIWHDGALARGYWMTGSGRLVLQGTNSEAPWSARGYDDVQGFPLVVLAVEPKIGHIAEASTTTMPGGDTETLAWYKCLWPPTSFDVLGGAPLPLAAPYPGDDPAGFVRFILILNGNPKARLSWLLDEAGTAVPGTRATTDGWKLDTTAPDPEIFSLADLPPIVSSKAQPD